MLSNVHAFPIRSNRDKHTSEVFPAYVTPAYMRSSASSVLVQTNLFRVVKTWLLISQELQLLAFQEAILSLGKWNLKFNFGYYNTKTHILMISSFCFLFQERALDLRQWTVRGTLLSAKKTMYCYNQAY